MDFKEELQTELAKAEPVFQSTYLVLPSDFTIKEWEALGHSLAAMKNNIDWWLGDWLTQGELKFGDEIYQFISDNLSPKTIWAIKNTCLTYPPHKRRPELSFTHHSALVAFDEEKRDKYLALAIKDRLSKNNMLELVKDDKIKSVDKIQDKYKSPIFISVPYSRDPARGIELSIKAGKFLKNKYVPVSPVLMFKDLYHNGDEYETVMWACKIIIRKCSAIFIVEDNEISPGQKIEWGYAKKSNKPIIFMEASELDED